MCASLLVELLCTFVIVIVCENGGVEVVFGWEGRLRRVVCEGRVCVGFLL